MITPELLIWLAIVAITIGVTYFLGGHETAKRPVYIRRDRVRDITPAFTYTRTTTRLRRR